MGRSSEDVEHGRAIRVVLRNDAQQLGGRHQRPTRPASPIEFRVGLHVAEPGVVVQPLLRVEQLRGHLDDLSGCVVVVLALSLIHISEPTRLGMISYAVFCLKKKKKKNKKQFYCIYI